MAEKFVSARQPIRTGADSACKALRQLSCLATQIGSQALQYTVSDPPAIRLRVHMNQK